MHIQKCGAKTNCEISAGKKPEVSGNSAGCRDITFPACSPREREPNAVFVE